MGAMEKAIFLGHYESRYSFDLCTFLKIPFFLHTQEKHRCYHRAMKIFQYLQGFNGRQNKAAVTLNPDNLKDVALSLLQLIKNVLLP